MTVALLCPHFAVVDRHMAPRQREPRQALYLLPFEHVVVDGRLLFVAVIVFSSKGPKWPGPHPPPPEPRPSSDSNSEFSRYWLKLRRQIHSASKRRCHPMRPEHRHPVLKAPVPFGILAKLPTPKRFCSVVKAQ